MRTEELLKRVIEDGLVLEETHFTELGLPDTPNLKKGKVRDNYFLGDELIIVTTDRVSAFDVNMRQGLPFKGYVLAEQTAFMFDFAGELGVKHHIKGRITPVCFRTIRANPGRIEWVFRKHLYGSAWRDVKEGKFKEKYGFDITPDMVQDGEIRKGCMLKEVICTPTTKAEEGHDVPLKRDDAIVAYGRGEGYARAEAAYRKLFEKAYSHMLEKGVIIPDTKFEEGFADDEPILIDEILTSDSSRFWPADEWEKRLEAGQDQVSMDKEYLRQWLIDSGFKDRSADLPVPVRVRTMMGYLNALQRMTGKTKNQINRELNEYYEMMMDDNGPEMMIYTALLNKGVIKGYCAVILAGSGSDLDSLASKETANLLKTLEELKVPYTSSVVSGHKDPDRLAGIVRWAERYPGDVVFIDRTGMSNGKDPNGGINIALAAAQILGLSHPELVDNVNTYKAGQRARGVSESMKYGTTYRLG